MKALFSIATRRSTDTADLARRIAARLAAGDCVTLSGPLGVGKTEFARALIRARLGDEALDVPSPTFTLVQYYEADMPLLHADLYRTERAEEWIELGLDEAMEEGLVLVEWPERAESYMPKSRLAIKGQTMPDGTRLWQFAGEASWATRLLNVEDV